LTREALAGAKRRLVIIMPASKIKYTINKRLFDVVIN